NRVLFAPLAPIDVDAQHATEQGGEILTRAERVGALSAVALSDVEHPVGAEGELAGAVIGKRLLDLENDEQLVGARVAQPLAGQAPLGDAAPRGAGAGCVIHIKQAVLPVLRVKGQSQKPELHTSSHLDLEH